MKSGKFVFCVLAPIFLFIFVFSLLPLVYGLGISFLKYHPLSSNNPFVGLANYAKLSSDRIFPLALSNTLKFVFITVVLNITITLIIARLITTLRSGKLRGFFRMIFFIPCVASLAAVSQVWGGPIYNTRYGLLNIIRGMFGADPINVLGSASTVITALIVFTLWADFGYNVILFSAGIESIPSTYDEAAIIDGAGPLQRFIHITIPLMQRTFVFVTMMTLISHFGMFVQFWVLANAARNNAPMVLTAYVYKLGFVNKDMGYASAVAFVLFGMIMLVTLLQRRFTKVDWGY